jgi:hypothetical protein
MRHKSILQSKSIAGRVRNATCLKNGTLFIEMFNKKWAETLFNANFLSSHLVHVERHSSHNSSQGVVTTDSLDGMSQEISPRL